MNIITNNKFGIKNKKMRKEIRNEMLLGIVSALVFVPVSSQAQLRKIATEEDTLRTHFMDIVKAVYPIEKECEVALRLKYCVPKDKTRKVAYYIKERERRKACYNYIYKDSILTRVLSKLEIDSIYRDSINSVLIPAKGNRISGDNVSLALYLSPVLKLDDAQYHYIMERALAMARVLYKDPRTNVWNEEMNLLKKTLTPEQLDYFFLNKNSDILTKEIDEGWQKIVDAGLSEQIDSAIEVPRAYFYYHERHKIKDIYRNNGTPQKKNLAELEKHKPVMVKMLETIEEKERKQKKEKTIGKEFVW